MAIVSLVENEYPLDDDETLIVKQVEISIGTQSQYYDPDQVTDLINQLEYFLSEMEKK